MARVELPQSKLRKRKRRRRLVVASIACASLVVLVGGAAWFSRAPFLKVRTISVTGAQAVASSTIDAYARGKMNGAYAWLFARDNIFLYPRAEIAKDLLAKYPELQSVDVHAENFHTVAVDVIERKPVALWCDSACYYIDETGLVYAPAPTYSDPIFVTYSGLLATSTEALPKQYLSEGKFQSLFALVTAINDANLGSSVESVSVDESDDVRAMFAGGFTLIWSGKDDGGDVFERLKLALQSDPFAGKKLSDFEYLDLRWGERLYYKKK